MCRHAYLRPLSRVWLVPSLRSKKTTTVGTIQHHRPLASDRNMYMQLSWPKKSKRARWRNQGLVYIKSTLRRAISRSFNTIIIINCYFYSTTKHSQQKIIVPSPRGEQSNSSCVIIGLASVRPPSKNLHRHLLAEFTTAHRNDERVPWQNLINNRLPSPFELQSEIPSGNGAPPDYQRGILWRCCGKLEMYFNSINFL